MTYDPRKSVEEFLVKHGELGRIALEEWNACDPLRCLYDGYEDPSEDGLLAYLNPDEYLGYAQRFVEELSRARISLNTPCRTETYADLVAEVVRRSFYPTQIAERWVELESISRIAMGILVRLPRAA